MNFSEKGIIIDIRYAKTTKAGEVQHIIIPQGKSALYPDSKAHMDDR